MRNLYVVILIALFTCSAWGQTSQNRASDGRKSVQGPVSFHWIGTGSGNGANWNQTGNWSGTQGGGSNGAIPSASFAVFIDGGTGGCNVDAASSCLSLTVSAQSLTFGAFTLTVGTDGVSITAGVLNLTGGTGLSDAGNWSYSGGTFTPGSVTVTFNGTTAQSIGGSTFYGLVFSGAGTKTATGNITVGAGNLTNTSTLDMGTNTLGGAGTITNTGGTIRFGGASNGVAIGTGTVEYYVGGQLVESGTYATLTLSNTSGTSVAGGNITATTLNTAAGGTLSMQVFTLGLTNVNNAGTIRTQNTSSAPITSGLTWGGTVQYDASSGQTAVAGIYNNLTVNNSAGVTLGGAVTVNGTLTMTAGNLTTTGSYTLTLGATATISGEATGQYVVGNLYKTEAVGAGQTYSTNSIGVSLKAGVESIGTLTVTRVTGTAGIVANPTMPSKTGIARKWTITSTNPPTSGRDLTLSWVSGDDNGKVLTSMQVWESTDAGATWQVFGTGTQDASTTHSVTVEVYSFSDWTVSDIDNSLPVQATDFLAAADIGSVTISWKTQSEVGNAGFNVLREDLPQAGQAGTGAFKLISSYTSNDNLKGLGTSSSGRAYSFVDKHVVSGATYQYQIQCVSTSGATANVGNVLQVTTSLPKDYALYQNYPNPFNPSTTVQFDLKEGSTVILGVYNVVGQKVQEWNLGSMNAGRYYQNINMDKYASGVYYYRIDVTGNDGQKFNSIKKLVLMK